MLHVLFARLERQKRCSPACQRSYPCFAAVASVSVDEVPNTGADYLGIVVVVVGLLEMPELPVGSSGYCYA